MERNSKHKKIIDNLIEMRDVVVPILGEDIFYISGENASRQSIHEYLLECFISEYGDENLTEEDCKVIVKGDYYGLSKLERCFPADFETDYRCYMRAAHRTGRIHIDETIKEFLTAFQFPLVITTSAFGFLEEMLTPVRYFTRVYSPKGSNVKGFDASEPTVYHIFGTIADGGEWVYDEDRLLEFLHALNNTDTSSIALKHYIDSKNCRLMAIGCNLPDWLFRFLWYPIKSTVNDSKQKKGYWINSRDNTDSFNDFLDNIKFYNAKEVRDLLAHAVSELKVQKNDAPEAADSRYDAFISYASEDKPVAQKIFDLLTAKGYKIWFDKDGVGKIEAGSNYMKRIEAGLANSDFYIPIITGNFITKVLNPESNLKKEVDMARNNLKSKPEIPDRYSVPIIIEGSKFNDEVITNAFVEGMTRFILPKQLFYHINMYTFAPADSTIDLTLR